MAAEYETLVLADSPEGYYRLDEASGTTAYDSSGNSRDADVLGSPDMDQPGVNGVNNASFRFASDEDGVLTPADSAFIGGQSKKSFELWFIRESVESSSSHSGSSSSSTNSMDDDEYEVLLAQGGPVAGYAVFLHAGELWFSAWKDSGAYYKTVRTAYGDSLRESTHVTGTYDADEDEMKLWVNGELEDSLTGSLETIPAHSNPPCVGRADADVPLPADLISSSSSSSQSV